MSPVMGRIKERDLPRSGRQVNVWFGACTLARRARILRLGLRVSMRSLSPRPRAPDVGFRCGSLFSRPLRPHRASSVQTSRVPYLNSGNEGALRGFGVAFFCSFACFLIRSTG